MTGVSRAMQEAAVARLLAASAVTDLVASTPDGPAVFAGRQSWPDRFPRVTIEKPQVLRRAAPCNALAFEVYLTLHCWANEPPASLVCGDLADAVIAALDIDIAPTGFGITGERHFESQREAGDPDPKVEHLVLTFRYLVNP